MESSIEIQLILKEIYMNRTLSSLVLLVSSGVLLVACGGSSSTTTSSTATSSVANTSTTTSSVTTPVVKSGFTAPFIAGSNSRYIFISGASYSTGVFSNNEQTSNGSMLSLRDIKLTGNPPVVGSINGNENYAMGTWESGTVNNPAITISSANNNTAHYIVYNIPASYPTTGKLTCESGVFTDPSYTGAGTVSVNKGTATGRATLDFDSKGAAVNLAITVTSGSASGSTQSYGNGIPPGVSSAAGGFFNNQSGSMVTVTDAGSGKYFVVAPYRVVLNTGSTYQGISLFLCK